MTKENVSTRAAAETAATALLPQRLTRAMITAAEKGISIMLIDPGTANPVIRLQELANREIFGRRSRRRRCRTVRSRRSRTVTTVWAMTVAREAPRMPRAGHPSQPKIMIGSRTQLSSAPPTIIELAVFDSPREIRMPFPIIGRAMKTAPAYQGSI